MSKKKTPIEKCDLAEEKTIKGPKMDDPRFGIHSKQDAFDWLAERGVMLDIKKLRFWHWEDRKLFYIIKDCEFETDPGYIEYCETHSDEGTEFIIFEPVDHFPHSEFPQRIKKKKGLKRYRKAVKKLSGVNANRERQ